MKIDYELSPVTFPEANSTVKGRDLGNGEQELGEFIKDTPCYADGLTRVTKWSLQGFWSRVLFLLNGEVYITVLGDYHPAIRVQIDTPFEYKKR